MDRLPTWATWSIIPATALLTPVLGFLVAVVAGIVLSLLKEAGMPMLLALATAGVGGFLLGRRSSVRQWDRGLVKLELQGRSSGIVVSASTANVMPFPTTRVRLADRHGSPNKSRGN
jgi:hypothetical protein